jgi:hypothetical protein
MEGGVNDRKPPEFRFCTACRALEGDERRQNISAAMEQVYRSLSAALSLLSVVQRQD